MNPVITIVGRPNVGKSTLFNRLTRSRDALVADFSGLTRDRHYGKGRIGERAFICVDTGGFEPVAKTGIVAEMAFDPKRDTHLHAIPVGQLFGANITRVGVRQGAYLRDFAVKFLHLLSPQITRALVPSSSVTVGMSPAAMSW